MTKIKNIISIFLIDGFECGGEDILRVIKFVMRLIDIVFILAPIILIVMVSVDFLKNVIAGKVDDMNKNVSLVIKRIISAVFLFLVPTVVNFAIFLLGNLGVEFMQCVNIAKKDNLSQYKIEYNIENGGTTNVDLNSNGSGIVVKERPNNNTTPGGSSSNSNNQNIFVGDSRFVGMKEVANDDSKWIAEIGQGYNWFINTALSELEAKISDGKKYNIIFNLGVNDLDNAKLYYEKYNSLVKSEKYKNCSMIFVSVNPVEDDKSTIAKNKAISSFNKQMKDNLNSKIKYCDTYSQIKDTFKSSGDGIHYTAKTSKDIYEKIKKCI